MMTSCNADELESPGINRSQSISSVDSWDTDTRLDFIEKGSSALTCSASIARPRPSSSFQSTGTSSTSVAVFPQHSYAQKNNECVDSSRKHIHSNRPLAVRTFRSSGESSGASVNPGNPYLIGNHDKDPSCTLHLGMRSESPSSQRLLFTVGKNNVPMQAPYCRENISQWRKMSSHNSSSLPQRSNSGRSLYGYESSQVDQTERMKTKLMSVWNNMKYGWTVPTKTNFSFLSPIFLLGQHYPERHRAENGTDLGRSSMERFKLDFRSRIWLTYRREFPALMGSTLTSDCGWGCMLRSGQMMLAQALVCHFLGRSWRSIGVPQTKAMETHHRRIVRWFGDDPSSVCPFSLHRLVAMGQSFGKKAGDWYGPASVAFILKHTLEKAAEENPMLDKVCIYIAQDCTVYKSDVIALCTSPPRLRKIPDQELRLSPRVESVSPLMLRTWSNPQLASKLEVITDHWRGAIIMVPVRLGGDRLNPIYIPCLQALLSHESCIGIIGGRPRHSLYFVGFQEDRLIHLDPHYCQESVDVLSADFPLESFHCSVPRKVPFAKMDPSCTIGFYFRTQDDFETFTESITPALIPPNQKSDYPIFVISPGSSIEASTGLPPEDNATTDGGSFDFESEEFVLL